MSPWRTNRYCIFWVCVSSLSYSTCNAHAHPLGEPGCTPFYMSLPSAWGSVDGDHTCFRGRAPNWKLWEIWKNEYNTGYGNRASHPIGAPLGDHGGGAPLPGILKWRWDFVLPGDRVCWGFQEICKRRRWKRAALSIGALLGNLEASFTGDSERRTKRGLETERLSLLWELWEGNLEKWLFYWVSRRICKGRLWKRASLSW